MPHFPSRHHNQSLSLVSSKVLMDFFMHDCKWVSSSYSNAFPCLFQCHSSNLALPHAVCCFLRPVEIKCMLHCQLFRVLTNIHAQYPSPQNSAADWCQGSQMLLELTLDSGDMFPTFLSKSEYAVTVGRSFSIEDGE